MGSIKDRNGMNLTEAEDVNKRWQKYTKELYKKDLYDPMDWRPPGSPVHGILEARILEWVAISYPGIEPASLMSPALAGGFFTMSATWDNTP